VFIAGSCDQHRGRLPAKRCRGDEPDLGRKTEILDIRNTTIFAMTIFAKTVLPTTVAQPSTGQRGFCLSSSLQLKNRSGDYYIKEVHSEWVLSMDSANTKRLP
jgi:hypothetical protein